MHWSCGERGVKEGAAARGGKGGERRRHRYMLRHRIEARSCAGSKAERPGRR
jgi:hypothetical protein